MQKYRQKLVVSGNIVELYQYDLWQFYDFTRQKRQEVIAIKNKLRSRFSNSRASRRIRNLVNSNPQLNKFFTLTFKENLTNLSLANNEFKNGVKRLKHKFGKFNYVCVVEFQKRGAVHYHLVCDLKYIPKQELFKVWKNGFIKINRVRITKEMGGYFVKNLCNYNIGIASSSHSTKDNYKIEQKLLAGRKKFFRSRGLFEPLIIKENKEVVEFYKKYLWKNKPFYQKLFNSDYCKVRYSEFNLIPSS